MEIDRKYQRGFQDYHFDEMTVTEDGFLLTMRDETGIGTMHCYDVFPGAMLAYNDFEMESSFQEVDTVDGFLQINHCRLGCFEYRLDGSASSFIGEGDLVVVDPGVQSIIASRFPLHKYEGVSVMLELAPAAEWLKNNIPWTTFDLSRIKEKIRSNKDPLLLRSNASIEHIFDELYRVDERVRNPYCILKILELLIFLGLAVDETRTCLPKFSQAVAEGTKEVHRYLLQNPLSHLTLGELSAKFHVAETSLKSCFKAIYGQTPGAFVRRERIRAGARLLLDFPEMTVGEISLRVGYENPSKFAKAFKSIMGLTPLVYRQRETAVSLEQKKDGLEWKTPRHA